MPNINLLPWREELREDRKREFLVILVASVVLAFFLIVIIYLVILGMVNNQKEVNNYLRQEITQLDATIQEIQQLQESKQRLVNRMEVIQSLQVKRPLTVRLFDEIVKILPNGIHVTSVKKEGNKIVIVGKAESNTRVSELMRNIENSKWLDDPTLTEIKRDRSGDRRVRDFTLQMEQKTVQELIHSQSNKQTESSDGPE